MCEVCRTLQIRTVYSGADLIVFIRIALTFLGVMILSLFSTIFCILILAMFSTFFFFFFYIEFVGTVFNGLIDLKIWLYCIAVTRWM